MQTTGLDHAATIPVGATLEAATWHLSGPYGPREAHESVDDAVREGIERHERLKAAYDEQQGAGAAIWPYPDHGFRVELRWRLKWPAVAATSGTTAPVMFHTYSDVEDARAHLARRAKYRNPLGATS